MRSKLRALAAACAFALVASAGAETVPPAPATAPVVPYEVANVYPHDRGAFTQGLFYLDGSLYESTGQVGQSTIRQVDPETGRVLRQVALPPPLFGEGIVLWDGEIISVTWRNGIGFRWRLSDFGKLAEFYYRGEGWGLTQDGENIIMSDGSAVLRFLDPETMRERRRVTVTANGRALGRLNELEWVDGEILANVWMTSLIARIDPESGAVTGWIDLSALAERSAADADSVLNGIAWDAAGKRLFVTGKNWPYLYEIVPGG